MARKPTDIMQIKFRGPVGLHRLITAEARKNKRSISQEMVHRLQKSFTQEINVDTMKVVAMSAAMDTVDIAFERLGMAKVFAKPDENQSSNATEKESDQ